MQLRPYQQEAHDAIIDYVRQHVPPCMVEAATGAGKSHIIAALAKTINDMSGKRILCLQPSAELVQQNREKYLLTGEPASVFSASAGGRCMLHPVVFGTPGTVKNSISRFGSQFAMVVIDECHEITPTIKKIIDAIRQYNPNLRVVGFTATPYRMTTGYIYRMDETGKPNSEDTARDPYFAQKVYSIGAYELIQAGYLTEPHVGDINAESYDTANIELNKRGQFDKADVDKAYHGHGRKTSAVVADIVTQSRGRRGVLIFAATIQHAEEVYSSLPPELSCIITSKTAGRKDIINGIKRKKYKYIVNVGVLTRGFDAPHIDVVALLRLTESVSLLQQMIGRVLRLYDGKNDALVLDYAGNIERHMPDGDLFKPDVKAAYKSGEQHMITVHCPSCSTEQEFSARPNLDGFEVSDDGYFLDLDGNKIKTDFGEMPAHFGRRCQALLPVPGGQFQQCDYRWSYKECVQCGHDNDIAARYCKHCKAELIDPNEKLRIEFKRMKRDPSQIQCDNVLQYNSRIFKAKSGNECLLIEFTTEYRTFTVYYRLDQKWQQRNIDAFHAAEDEGLITVTYQKNSDSGYYSVYAYNQEVDECEIPQ